MKRVATVTMLAAGVALGLAGCAVPGEELPPGAAFAVKGSVVTQADVDATYQGWVNDTEGKDVPNRRQVMTLEAIHDPIVELAKQYIEGTEVTLSEDEGQDVANQWLSFLGLPNEASPEVARSAQSAFALMIVVFSDPDGSDLIELAAQLEEQVDGGPRSGIFDGETFLASAYAALDAAQNQSLQQFSFTAFQNVNGFVDEPTELRQKEAAE